MKKYSIKEINNWLTAANTNVNPTTTFYGIIPTRVTKEMLDRANSPSEKVKNAHIEMDEEDQEEDLDTFKEGDARVIVY